MLRGQIQSVTDRLLDQVEPRGSADLIVDLAYPLPITIICDLLGIPAADRGPIQKWGAVIDASGPEDSLPDVRRVTDDMEAFLIDQVAAAEHRDPGSDLLADLVARQQEGALSRDEVTSMAFLLLVGGHETTTALIGSAILALLLDPALAGRARTDMDTVSGIIEESLRRDAPFRNATWRFPTEPVTIAGQAMQPGDPILVSLLAANRDPAVFDEPDSIRPGRPGRHVGFGYGPHVCLGAALARLEGAIAVSSVLRRFPSLRLAVPAEELRWWPSPISRGLYALPVVW